MNCLSCNTSNDKEANFCKNCGTDLTYSMTYRRSNSNSSDTFLLIYLCIALFGVIVQFTLDKISQHSFTGIYKYARGFIWVITSISTILIPLSVKDKHLKTVSFIIAAILIVYWTMSNLQFMLS